MLVFIERSVRTSLDVVLFLLCTGGGACQFGRGRGVYLDSGLGQVDTASQILPDEGIGVVSPLKDSLQRLQLAAVEGGPVPALLSLLLLLRVHLLVCGGRSKRR